MSCNADIAIIITGPVPRHYMTHNNKYADAIGHTLIINSLCSDAWKLILYHDFVSIDIGLSFRQS